MSTSETTVVPVVPVVGDDATRTDGVSVSFADETARQPGPAAAPTPPLSPRLALIRGVLLTVFALTLALLLQVVVLSQLQQRAAQRQAFDDFRSQLAEGTAPRGPNDYLGEPLTTGDPVARLEIPVLDLDQIVLEGTASGVLYQGPGHRRDTVLPGQVGTSVIFGRRAAYGAPFAYINELQPGDAIIATTAQGTFEYVVQGVRREGDPLLPRADGAARLTLLTATGPWFFPDDVVRVDADLAPGLAVVGEARTISIGNLPERERAMARDTSSLWALALWLQALIALSVALVWSWGRWGRARTWIVFLAPSLFVTLGTAGEIVRLLPNLL